MSAPFTPQVRELDTGRCRASGELYRSDRALCQQEIADDLKAHGFSLVSSAGILDGLVKDTMDVAEDRRFALSPTAKQNMRSESLDEGYVAGTHKEMFHFTSRSGSVQQPSCLHMPTAPGGCFAAIKGLGEGIFNGINAHAFGLLKDFFFEQDAFVQDDDYFRWVNAVRDSSAHVLTSFFYHESNPDTLHSAAHVDKGLLTICTNVADLEVCVKGEWVSLGPHQSSSPDVVAVLTGYTLERATNGLFRAVRHRVRNNGRRRSRVMKLRLDPSLTIKPASIIANVPLSLV